MRRRFLRDSWNRGHIGSHSVSEREAEAVVRAASASVPAQDRPAEAPRVGQDVGRQVLSVIFVIRAAAQIDYESIGIEDIINLGDDDVPRTYVIHARDLTPAEKSRYRRSL